MVESVIMQMERFGRPKQTMRTLTSWPKRLLIDAGPDSSINVNINVEILQSFHTFPNKIMKSNTRPITPFFNSLTLFSRSLFSMISFAFG